NATMERLANECLETEVIELKSMYGASKTFQTISDIHSTHYQHFKIRSSTQIPESVTNRLCDYGGSKNLLTQLLDEEQQREQKRSSPGQLYEHQLHDEIKILCEIEGHVLNLTILPSVFCPIADAFLGTIFYSECQPR
ncbi:unnamed protein product, partial [Rotaria socialis]